MKTFEEKFTAWVDGRLTGADLADYEHELESHPDALAEKEAALELGNLLRSHLCAPPLRNEDFFNHQILHQIEVSQMPPRKAPGRLRSFLTLPRMAFSGAFFLLLAAILFFAAVPNTRRDMRHNQQYVIHNLTDPSEEANISATSFHSKQNNVDVLWLDGLTYMPRKHHLK